MVKVPSFCSLLCFVVLNPCVPLNIFQDPNLQCMPAPSPLSCTLHGVLIPPPPFISIFLIAALHFIFPLVPTSLEYLCIINSSILLSQDPHLQCLPDSPLSCPPHGCHHRRSPRIPQGPSPHSEKWASICITIFRKDLHPIQKS